MNELDWRQAKADDMREDPFDYYSDDDIREAIIETEYLHQDGRCDPLSCPLCYQEFGS